MYLLFEVEEMQHQYEDMLENEKTHGELLKYDNDKIGCCGIVYHPKFQDRGYPITLFTTLDLHTLIKILAQ